MNYMRGWMVVVMCVGVGVGVEVVTWGVGVGVVTLSKGVVQGWGADSNTQCHAGEGWVQGCFAVGRSAGRACVKHSAWHHKGRMRNVTALKRLPGDAPLQKSDSLHTRQTGQSTMTKLPPWIALLPCLAVSLPSVVCLCVSLPRRRRPPFHRPSQATPPYAPTSVTWPFPHQPSGKDWVKPCARHAADSQKPGGSPVYCCTWQQTMSQRSSCTPAAVLCPSAIARV
jgi:hypothetical protein